MPRKASERPTDVELEILAALWQRGPSTVREVHNELSHGRQTGYSTTLKMMQIMHAKGLLTRDDSERPQRYRPVKTKQATQLRLIDDLVKRAFDGAAGRLLVRAISAKRLAPQEIAEVKKLIDGMENKK